MTTKSIWTPELFDELRRLICIEHLTALQAAKSLSEQTNQPITKNMVIGRCSRTGITLNPDPRHFLTSTDLDEIRKAKSTESSVAIARRLGVGVHAVWTARAGRTYKQGRPKPAAPTPNPFPDASGCLWPLGHPNELGFHFCGGSRLPGKPYCSSHSAVAYVRRPVAAVEVV
jgi:GcrA cell cycle regulator